MGYKDIYRESNEDACERMDLAVWRLIEIGREETVPERFREYFRRTASFGVKVATICKACAGAYSDVDRYSGGDEPGIDGGAAPENGRVSAAEMRSNMTLAAYENENRVLYEHMLPESYGTSFANPSYAVQMLGAPVGQYLCVVAAHLYGAITHAYRGNILRVVTALELLISIYNHIEPQNSEPEETSTDYGEIKREIYWYFHDNNEIFTEEAIRRLIDPNEDFEYGIVMGSDLSDLCYLYRYGAHIGENERGIASFLNEMPDDDIKLMADTMTEGYRIGFEATGKDLSIKKTAQIRYPIGFERVVREAIKNLEALGLKVTLLASGISANRQYDFDHREDDAVYLDKAVIERKLEVYRTTFEENEKLSRGMAGPAVIEVFGEEPFAPVAKDEAPRYDAKQRELSVYDMGKRGEITNRYIPGEERSFTIIAFPIPEIGDRFKEIFAETVRINTLDYMLYRDIQQRIIDVLDTADRVHITGRGSNKTDLYVNIYKLTDPAHQTAFENCVADVNIPVGEVFTSPVLKGTTGKLYVGQVYLSGLNYNDLEIDFTDGMVTGYTCSNFDDEEDNKKYIRDNILMHHETLPMGEFAIGTNTTAYHMARKYDIADKLPILIAEKTGPHFAVGDTCYSHEEDNVTYNPDGKAIVARENDISALRKVPAEDGGGAQHAYFNCHTDITIPYDELDRITVIRADGTETDIIAGGIFVLPGTEELNKPLYMAMKGE